MSKIIVKNLPPEINEEVITKIFSQKGTLTSVDLKRYSSTGRPFAFIGYQYEHEAAEAIRSLNNTFIKTNKILVEICHDFHRGQMPKSQQSQSNKALKNSLKKKFPLEECEMQEKRPRKDCLGLPIVQQVLVEKYKSEPEFAAFLDLKSPEQAAQVREKLNLPAKDLGQNALLAESEDFPFKQEKLKKRDVMSLLYHVKLRKLPKRTNKTQIREFFHPLECVVVDIPKKTQGLAYVAFMTESEREQALQKDNTQLKDELVRVVEHEYRKKVVVDLGPTTYRLYFSDLPSSSSVDDVIKLFSSYGELKSLVIPKYQNELEGYGLATYINDADARKAYEDLSKTLMKDKIVISPERSGKVPTRHLQECERTAVIFDVLRTVAS